MSYPLHAFATVNPAAAAPGTLLRFPNMWAFKVEPIERGGKFDEEMLILKGAAAGSFATAPNGEAVTIAAPFEWHVYVDGVDGDRNNEHWPAVTIGADGPVLHGHAWRTPIEGMAANLTGQRVSADSALEFIANFSIWLIDSEGRKVGDEPLLQVHSPARAPRVSG